MSTTAFSSSRMRPQDRAALQYGSVVLAALLVYALVVRPSIEQSARDRTTVGEQRALLAREHALIVDAAKYPAADAAARRTLSSELPRLFEGDSVAAAATLSSYLADAAGADGVKIQRLDARAGTTALGVTALDAELRAEGTWSQVLTFLHALEISGRLLTVSDVRIERGPRGGPLGGSQVSLSASVTGYARGAR